MSHINLHITIDQFEGIDNVIIYFSVLTPFVMNSSVEITILWKNSRGPELPSEECNISVLS